jgi:hypothetical protein
MTTEDRGAMLASVNALVNPETPRWMYDAVTVLGRTKAKYPLVAVGDLAVLNPLIDLFSADHASFERVMALVDKKRAEIGVAPIRTEEETGFDKRAYMRDFMEQKRVRQRRAATIENFARSANDALRGSARLEFMDAQSAKWKVELDKRLAVARDAAGTDRLAKPLLETLRAQFWTWVDTQLDEAERQSKLKLRRI